MNISKEELKQIIKEAIMESKLEEEMRVLEDTVKSEKEMVEKALYDLARFAQTKDPIYATTEFTLSLHLDKTVLHDICHEFFLNSPLDYGIRYETRQDRLEIDAIVTCYMA